MYVFLKRPYFCLRHSQGGTACGLEQRPSSASKAAPKYRQPKQTSVTMETSPGWDIFYDDILSRLLSGCWKRAAI